MRPLNRTWTTLLFLDGVFEIKFLNVFLGDLEECIPNPLDAFPFKAVYRQFYMPAHTPLKPNDPPPDHLLSQEESSPFMMIGYLPENWSFEVH